MNKQQERQERIDAIRKELAELEREQAEMEDRDKQRVMSPAVGDRIRAYLPALPCDARNECVVDVTYVCPDVICGTVVWHQVGFPAGYVVALETSSYHFFAEPVNSKDKEGKA